MSAALQFQLAGCYGGDCNCPAPPKRPAGLGPLPITQVSAHNDQGNFDSLPVDPTGGTVEVTGEQIIIRYAVDDEAREVVYDVLDPE